MAQAAPWCPLRIPRPKWQVPGEWKLAAFPELSALRQWAGRSRALQRLFQQDCALLGGMELPSAHPGLRNQKCQLARSNQHKEHDLTHRVNRGNTLLQAPVHAQNLHRFKIKRINSWKQSSSGFTKHREIAQQVWLESLRHTLALVLYICP